MLWIPCRFISNSCGSVSYEAVKASVLRAKDPTATTGRTETLAAFLLSRANGSATTRISDSRLKPCIDEGKAVTTTLSKWRYASDHTKLRLVKCTWRN